MVAESVPTRFTLDPARADEFIDDLSAVENSLRHVAEKWNTTVGALSLFLASPEGLAIVAAAEIATAVHIRLQAQALLVDVAQSMVYIVREYSREERRIPFNNDLRSIKLVELRRANARRAGNLLLRLAHYNPAPIRSYTVNTAPHKEPTPPQGGTPKPRTSSPASEASNVTIASAVPPVVGVAAVAVATIAEPGELSADESCIARVNAQPAAVSESSEDAFICSAAATPANPPPSAQSFSSGP